MICQKQSKWLIRAKLYIGVFAVSLCPVSNAQSAIPDSQKPTSYQVFDVVSVKRNVGGGGVSGLNADALSFYAKNVSLKTLVGSAYGVRQSKILGLPTWAKEDKWDIQAKVSDPDSRLAGITPSPQEALRIYRMHVLFILESRFGLKARLETKTDPIYQMVIAPRGAKLSLTQTPENEQGLFGGLGQINGDGITMKDLAEELSDSAGRDVRDATGLSGKYDVHLRWSPDDTPGTENTAPPLLVALQEQAGLRLVPAMGDVTVLIVDSIRPAEKN